MKRFYLLLAVFVLAVSFGNILEVLEIQRPVGSVIPMSSIPLKSS